MIKTENFLRRRFLLEVGDFRSAVANGRGRLSTVKGSSCVENLHCLFGNKFREVRSGKGIGLGASQRVFRPIAALVGDHQLHIAPPAKRPVAFEAVDRQQVVAFLPQPVVVECRHGGVDHLRRMEAIQRVTTRPCHASWLKLEESLVRRHLAGLRRTRHSFELLQRLPTQPTELVIVPHAYERPARTRVLQVRIVQVRAIDSAVVIHGCRDVKVANLLPRLVANEVAYPAIVHALWTVLRVPDDLVDEITQMQHELQLFLPWRSLILKDHPPVSILCALVGILAGHKSEAHRPRVVHVRRCHGAADPAAVAFRIRKPVPIDCGGS